MLTITAIIRVKKGDEAVMRQALLDVAGHVRAAGQTQPVMPPQPAPNRQPIAPAVVPFPSTPLVTTPQYRPLSVPRPIVCSVTGDAQLATVLCH